MSDPTIAAVLGQAPEVFEESWTIEEIPHQTDICVPQRCLILQGFPTGQAGRPWIDGVIGPDTRRALRQWQEEHGFATTGHFETPVRAALIDETVALLAAMPDMQRVHASGQLAKLQNMHPMTGKLAARYFAGEAIARVDETIVPVFLALYASINNGILLPGLEITDYLRRCAAGESPREARRLALRYGFLQLSGKMIADHPQLDLDRAANPGDLAYHFDMLGIMLREDGALRKAAEKHDATGIERALAHNAVGCVLAGPQTIGEALAEVIAVLNRGE